MTNVPADSALSRIGLLVPAVRAGWAWGIAILSWVVGYFAWFAVSGAIEFKECGLDPLTFDETEKCASVSNWAGVSMYGWLASPFVWILAALLLWLASKDVTAVRRVAVWCTPVLPIAVILMQIVVYLLYGPLPA